VDDSRARTVLVLATLDTKADEARHLARALESRSLSVHFVDLALQATSPSWAHTSVQDVRAAASTELRADTSKSGLMSTVVDGASALERHQVEQGEVVGLIALGGGQGTFLATGVMRPLPLGLPKVLVTTLATRAGGYLGTADIVVVPSITDVAGLNPVLQGSLDRAAGALAGMVEATQREQTSDSPLVAVTMFGVTTTGGTLLRARLEEQGHCVAVFHANGTGGSTMERLVDEGRVHAVLDWTTTELADELLGGIATAGPDRLTAAARRGVPQLIVPGAIDIVNFGAQETIPGRYAGRRLYQHTPAATLLRTDPAEARELGAIMARKANDSHGPTAVVVPARGFSALSAPGEPFHDSEADQAFIDALGAGLSHPERLHVLDHHINEPAFVDAVASHFARLVDGADATPDPSHPQELP
jgi:uncharacterized protein (UPF0261 family)